MNSSSRWPALALGVALPIVLIAVILGADAAEGPKTAYVGVLSVVPMLAAVFGTPLSTLAVGIVTWLAAFGFGQLASDGNVAAQRVRLIIIAIVTVAAVGAAYLRQRRERDLATALRAAAETDVLRHRAETDQLTGLYNRHAVTARVHENATAERTVAIVDCDYLKTVNDEHGHNAGDEYLRAIAGRLSGSISRDDLLARWGGDEFLIVQNLPLAAARSVLERMMAAVSSTPISAGDATIAATVSIGAAHWAAEMSFDQVLQQADHALLKAKAAGRNQIGIAQA
jgi:diguanylate cyclase (GGDEF)-like protein